VSVGVSRRPNEDSGVGSSRALFCLWWSDHHRCRELDRRRIRPGVAAGRRVHDDEALVDCERRPRDGGLCPECVETAGRPERATDCSALTDTSGCDGEPNRPPRNAAVRAARTAESNDNAGASADDVSAAAGDGDPGRRFDVAASVGRSSAAGVRSATDDAANAARSSDARDACNAECSSASEWTSASIRRAGASSGARGHAAHGSRPARNADAYADQSIPGE
jgi:hypothetical protein